MNPVIYVGVFFVALVARMIVLDKGRVVRAAAMMVWIAIDKRRVFRQHKSTGWWPPRKDLDIIPAVEPDDLRLGFVGYEVVTCAGRFYDDRQASASRRRGYVDGQPPPPIVLCHDLVTTSLAVRLIQEDAEKGLRRETESDTEYRDMADRVGGAMPSRAGVTWKR